MRGVRLALAVDEALAVVLAREVQPARVTAPKVGPPAGFRFESAVDWGVPMYDEQRAAQRRAEMLAEYGR